MKKAKLAFISVIVSAIFAVVAIFVTGYDEKENQEKTLQSVARKADVTIKNIHYVKTNRGVKEWEIKASSGHYFKDRDLAIFKNVRVTVFFKDGDPLVLVGDEGRVPTDSRDVEIWGNVLVTSDKGYQFRTQSLKYNSKKRKIVTPDEILFTGYGMELRGVGITIDIDTERFFVLDNVLTLIRDTRVN